MQLDWRSDLIIIYSYSIEKHFLCLSVHFITHVADDLAVTNKLPLYGLPVFTLTN